jgi:hypothetical protein
MPHYTITARITVDVEMTVEAGSEDEARKIFNDGICMSASLADVPEIKYSVSEDSISDVDRIRVRREAP